MGAEFCASEDVNNCSFRIYFDMFRLNSTAEQLAVVDWNQTVGFYSFDDGGRPVSVNKNKTAHLYQLFSLTEVTKSSAMIQRLLNTSAMASSCLWVDLIDS